LQPNGSICALVTPFDEAGAIDLPALDRLVALHLRSRTSALVIGGSTGESGALESAELTALLQRARKTVGSMSIWGGIGASSTAKALELLQVAESGGAQTLLAVTPYYVRPTQSGLIKHYLALADAASVPLVLYNVPARTGCDLLPETVAELVAHPSIVGIKDAVTDQSRLQALLALQGPEFAILSGDDETAAEWMNNGAAGVVSVVANAIPAAYARLSALAVAGDEQSSTALNERLVPLYKALSLAPNPICIKWLVARLGLCRPDLRLPLTELETPHEAPLAAAFDRAQHD